MGYYTQYGISFCGPDKLKEQFKKELLDISKDEDGDVDSCLKDLLSSSFCEAKLYDLCDWINELAPKYPELLIILWGDGEEPEDHWEQRWKGGLRERQFAIIPPFQNKELWTEYEKEHENNNN